MAQISVNVAGSVVLCAGVAEPRLARGSKTEVMTDRETGQKLYRLPVLLIQPGIPGQLILVTVPGLPQAPVSAPLTVEGLRVSSWEMDGRSGMSWRADGIEAIGGPSVDEHGAPTVALGTRPVQRQAS